ncbi:MAG: copper resistance protein NlpE N-terminal domain-containing protein [Fibrobacterota bacterium]|nr:copper resistance protein NlpE N-terminal domain-containing protein [Chitinispirillaceae bacterium]
MKKHLLVCALVTAFAVFSCSNDPANTSDNNPITTPDTTNPDTIPTVKPDTTPTPDFVGNWVGTFPAIPGKISDSVRITVLINKDTTFKLNAIYITTQDTALRDNGVWKTSKASDSIYLHGNDCAIWDTTQKVLKPLENCGDPAAIIIDIDKNAKSWKIPMSSLAPLSVAFNIKLDDPLIVALLASLSITVFKQ